MYTKIINNLHLKLKDNADITVHSFKLYPRLPKNKLEKLVFDYKLPDNLISFYNEINGFQLSYTFSDNKDFNKDEFGYYQESFPAMWPNENYWHLDGCINILPIDYLLQNSWKDYIWFDSDDKTLITYKDTSMSRLQFEMQLKPLDVFSKSSIAAIFVQNKQCDVLLGVDHNASFTDFPAISFDDYIDGIIAKEGKIEERSEIFENKG